MTRLRLKFPFTDTIDEALVFCQSCKHGGHESHIAEWFYGNREVGEPRRTCAVIDCTCYCDEGLMSSWSIYDRHFFMYTSCIVLYNIRNEPMTALHVCRRDQNVVEDHRICIVRRSPRSLQKRVLSDQISCLPHLTYTSQILYSYSPHFSSTFYDILLKLLDFNGRCRSRFWLFGQQGKQLGIIVVFLILIYWFSSQIGVARKRGIDIITNEVSNRSTP